MFHSEEVKRLRRKIIKWDKKNFFSGFSFFEIEFLSFSFVFSILVAVNELFLILLISFANVFLTQWFTARFMPREGVCFNINLIFHYLNWFWWNFFSSQAYSEARRYSFAINLLMSLPYLFLRRLSYFQLVHNKKEFLFEEKKVGWEWKSDTCKLNFPPSS